MYRVIAIRRAKGFPDQSPIEARRSFRGLKQAKLHCISIILDEHRTIYYAYVEDQNGRVIYKCDDLLTAERELVRLQLEK